MQRELNELAIPVFSVLLDQTEESDGLRIELLHYDSLDDFWPAERKFLRQIFEKVAQQHDCRTLTPGDELIFELMPVDDGDYSPERERRYREIARTQVTVAICPHCGFQQLEELVQ